MTQSGQDGEPQSPAVGPAHEGLVLPANGEPWAPSGQASPAEGAPWGRSWGPDSAQPGQGHGQSHGQDAYGVGQPAYGGGPGAPAGVPSAPSYGAMPLPPEGAPPMGHPSAGPDAQATQFMAPVAAAGPDAQATQLIPPVGPGPGGPGGPDAQATQLIPPVSAGTLPPEHTAGDSTHFLGRRPGGPDAQATQYLPPVPAGPTSGQQGVTPYGAAQAPPSEFDALFRSERQGPPPGSVTAPGRSADGYFPPRQPETSFQPQPGRYGAGDAGDGGRRSMKPATTLIAAVVVGCAVVGLTVGALMSGDDEPEANDGTTVSASSGPKDTAPAEPEPSEDPARTQAVELDKLLAESNDSRAKVIAAVQSIKTCDNLGQAAGDLRAAAGQRNGLVDRLKDLSVDKLPDHAKLTAALTKAWKASASADEHYAAWADQTAGPKGCRKGQARVTGQTAAGNRASGEATAAKTEAASLWNPIAETYGLTKRQTTEL
ncbi:hypothetical protein [Streptomyces sp. GC420]|uniref:hypothetical protein n=1 Tax=Streptomyces sp. GC420 TaxID=2697568 RepID=UPI001414FF80|nr:hypothetical protein [Streptomyces sp. GC420]NBM18879.1 hypothetical protein [Streptomyces sp. GC420]